MSEVGGPKSVSGDVPTTMVEKVAATEVADARSPVNQRRLVLRLLAAAIFLQNLVWLVVLRSSGTDWPSVPAVIAMGLVFAQVGLAAVLVMWGSGNLLLRSLVAVPLLVFAAILASRSTNENLPAWTSILLAITAIIGAPLAVARLAGVRIVNFSEPLDLAGSRQFTIFGLLTLTTLVAVILGVCRLLQFPWEEIGQVALFAVALGGIPWICAPTSLAANRWHWVVIPAVVVCPLAGWLISFTGLPPEQHKVALIAMACIQGALTISACAVVRVAGYRLVWPKMGKRSSR
jgi:hypothetical protein